MSVPGGETDKLTSEWQPGLRYLDELGVIHRQMRNDQAADRSGGFLARCGICKISQHRTWSILDPLGNRAGKAIIKQGCDSLHQIIGTKRTVSQGWLDPANALTGKNWWKPERRLTGAQVA
jgi:hypothetical protein